MPGQRPQTNDTAAIQLAVNQVEGAGTVLIPDGTYMIDALTSISIKSDLTFRMSNGAVLKAIPNSAAAYSIIKIENAFNASLIGGTLLGDRDEHLGSGGEWGMGVFINSASNISITGMTAQNAWGNRFYVRGASKNITFCSVVANNNRRQGMSIISVNGLVIRDSVFQNTNEYLQLHKRWMLNQMKMTPSAMFKSGTLNFSTTGGPEFKFL